MTNPPNPEQPDGSAWQAPAHPQPAPPAFYPAAAPPPAQYGFGVPPQTPIPGEVADMGRRLAARAIDSAIVVVVFVAFIVAWVGGMAGLGSFEEDAPPPLFFVGLLFIYLVLPLAAVLYEVLLTGLRGATLGKMALGIKVVRQDTFQVIGIGNAFLRWLIPAVGSVVCIGTALVYASPLFDDSGRRQGWHDMLAKDLVLLKR